MPTRPRRQALVQGDGLKSSRWIAASLRQGVPGHAAHPSEREPRRGPAHRSPHFVRGQTRPPERTPRRVRGPPWTAQWPPHSAEGTPRRVRGRYHFVRGPPPLAGTPPPPRPGSSLNGAGWLPFPGAKTPPRPGNTPASPGAPPFHAGEALGLWKLPFQGRTPGLVPLAAPPASPASRAFDPDARRLLQRRATRLATSAFIPRWHEDQAGRGFCQLKELVNSLSSSHVSPRRFAHRNPTSARVCAD